MKRKVCIIICGLMLALALCSCGQSSSSSSKTTSSNSASGENVTTEEKKSLNKADLGWLKFDIPEDFRLDEDSKYTDASIVKKGDSSCKLNFFYVGSSKDIDMDTAIQDILEENGGELVLHAAAGSDLPLDLDAELFFKLYGLQVLGAAVFAVLWSEDLDGHDLVGDRVLAGGVVHEFCHR